MPSGGDVKEQHNDKRTADELDVLFDANVTEGAQPRRATSKQDPLFSLHAQSHADVGVLPPGEVSAS